MPLISVNVACYNHAKNLPCIFEAYNSQEFKDFELIICDDGSQDNTKLVVEHFKKRMPYKIKYVWQEDKGFRLASNQNNGLKVAAGKYLVNTNGDIIPSKIMLKNYSKYLDKNLVLVGVRHDIKPEIIFAEKEEELYRRNVMAIDWRSSWLENIDEVDKPYRDVSGCNFCFPIWAGKKVGGWDDSFDGENYYCDDYLFCFKLFKLGLKFKAVYSAFGYHIWHPKTLQIHTKSLEKLKQLEKEYEDTTNRR